jgi:hypothetical protein
MLELLSIISLMYALLLIFLYFAPAQAMAVIFVWTVAVCLFYNVSRNWHSILRISILLLLVPLLFFNNRVALVFFFITVPSLFVYVDRFLHRGNRSDYVGNLKKAGTVFIIALYLRWILPNIGQAIALAAPYIFVYFLSTILLIRSIRHIEAGMEIRRLQKSNIKYLIFIAGVFVLTAVKDVREFLITIAKKIIDLLLLPIQILLRLLEWLSDILRGIETKFPSKPWTMPEIPDPVGEAPPPMEAVEEVLPTFAVAEKVLIALVVAAAILIIYKLLFKAGERSYQGLSYVEEREYIKKKRKKPRGRFSLRNKPPAEPGELVRYYYRKFLGKLAANKVELSPLDTSQDVEAKAEAVFSHGPAEIRDIYIPSRYGGKKTDAAIATEMEQLYKGLEKGGH